MFLKAVEVRLRTRFEDRVFTEPRYPYRQGIRNVAVPFLQTLRTSFINKDLVKRFYKGEDSSWDPKVLPTYTTVELVDGTAIDIEGTPELFALQYSDKLRQGHT